MQPAACGIEPGLELGFGEPSRRLSSSGSDGTTAVEEELSWRLFGCFKASLDRKAASSHCVHPRSAKISQCSWARG
jgi:hypothetical protein